MARHVADLARFKSVVEKNEIKKGLNAKNLIDKSNPTKEFDSKQQLLEMVVHAADVSTQTRPFHIAHKWTYLLFDEFFT